MRLVPIASGFPGQSPARAGNAASVAAAPIAAANAAARIVVRDCAMIPSGPASSCLPDAAKFPRWAELTHPEHEWDVNIAGTAQAC